MSLGAPDFGGITRRKQTADWTTHPAPLQIHSFCPGRNRACPVNTGHEKNAKFLNRLLKKERLGVDRSRPVTNKKTGPLLQDYVLWNMVSVPLPHVTLR